MRSGRYTLVVLFVWTACVASTIPAAAQWQIESKDGKDSLKIGFLIQPQAELLELPDGEGTSTNVFVRRLRVLLGGTFGERWSFFIETDSPNLGKATPRLAGGSGAKDQGDIFVQDAYVTYSANPAFKVDAGLIMLPHSRNGTQSAATLLAVDYAPYTFLDSGPSGERVGRDYGIQFRGYPLKQRLEYRVSIAQGVRGPNAENPLRVSGRCVYYPFAAETGFFYAGTFQGTRRQLGIGGGFDVQKDARIFSADVFFETPLVRKTQGATLQFNWMHYDGGAFMPSIAEQDALLFEAGYHLLNHRLTPFVQFQRRDFAASATPDQSVLQIGAAWWLAGHNRNVKVSVGRLHTDGQQDRIQFLLQLQVFYF